mgnify:CR=1 FL=1
MYKIGYIDDEPAQYANYAKKLNRRYPDMKLILFEKCSTREEFVNKIYEEQADVLLIDYKMASTYGFNGTSLISYINDRVQDLECFILTAVEQERITDGLVAKRNRFSKTIFDTEGDDPDKVKAEVFKLRRMQKVERYRELLEKRKSQSLHGTEEDEYLNLYRVLSSYGMVEKLPQKMLESKFDKDLEQLLKVGDAILKEYGERE